MSLDTKRFAQTLIEMSYNEHREDIYFNRLRKLNDLLNRDAELRRLVDDYEISPERKAEKLGETFGSEQDRGIIYAFFQYISTLNRKQIELAVLHDYMELTYTNNGMMFGQLYSARVLDKNTIRKIESAISYALDHRVAL